MESFFHFGKPFIPLPVNTRHKFVVEYVSGTFTVSQQGAQPINKISAEIRFPPALKHRGSRMVEGKQTTGVNGLRACAALSPNYHERFVNIALEARHADVSANLDPYLRKIIQIPIDGIQPFSDCLFVRIFPAVDPL